MLTHKETRIIKTLFLPW